MNTLGAYIAKRRKTLRLTQEEVSERLRAQGIDRAASTIAGWEGGHQEVPIELIPQIAKALEDSTVGLYEAAGVLAALPGSEIIKLLDGLPDKRIEKIEAVIKTLLEYE